MRHYTLDEIRAAVYPPTPVRVPLVFQVSAAGSVPAGGRPVGLYESDGLLVYDPAAGEPELPTWLGNPLMIGGEADPGTL